MCVRCGSDNLDSVTVGDLTWCSDCVSSVPLYVFRDRLRMVRKRRGFSQDDLAKRAGLQASAISHFETGTRKPSFNNLLRLADALEITTDYLVGRADYR